MVNDAMVMTCYDDSILKNIPFRAVISQTSAHISLDMSLFLTSLLRDLLQLSIRRVWDFQSLACSYSSAIIINLTIIKHHAYPLFTIFNI